MSEEPLELLDPTVALRDAYLTMVEEFRLAGEPFHQGERAWVLTDFEGYVRSLYDGATGLNLPPGWVPGSVYWLVRDGVVVGTSRLRHRLTPSLEIEGGHIGYDIRPSERRKGYATRLLALVLEKARRRGLTRVLVTCDKDNVASARVIRKNGGLFDGDGTPEGCTKLVSRYWIELGERP